MCLQWLQLSRRLFLGLCWNFPLCLNSVTLVGYIASTASHTTLGQEYKRFPLTRKCSSGPASSTPWGILLGLCCAQSLSWVWLFGTPWAVAPQAPLCMGVSRQEHWSGLPCRPPGDLPSPGIELGSPALQVDSLPAEFPGKHLHPTPPPPIELYYAANCTTADPLLWGGKKGNLKMSVSQFANKEQQETQVLVQNSKWKGDEYLKLISKCQIQSTLKSSLQWFPNYCISSRGHPALL